MGKYEYDLSQNEPYKRALTRLNSVTEKFGAMRKEQKDLSGKIKHLETVFTDMQTKFLLGDVPETEAETAKKAYQAAKSRIDILSVEISAAEVAYNSGKNDIETAKELAIVQIAKIAAADHAEIVKKFIKLLREISSLCTEESSLAAAYQEAAGWQHGIEFYLCSRSKCNPGREDSQDSYLMRFVAFCKSNGIDV